MKGPPNGDWMLCARCKNLRDNCGLLNCIGYKEE